jgi:chromosome segregation ATPase
MGIYMIPMTSVEVLQDLLKFAKDLTPLLTEKKLDSVIAGLAEARATVERHKSIQAEIVAADEKLAKAKELEALNAEQDKTLSIAAADLGDYNLELGKREAQIAAKEGELAKLQAQLAKSIASYEKKEAAINELVAKSDADAKEIETAKLAITAKLAKLQEV